MVQEDVKAAQEEFDAIIARANELKDYIVSAKELEAKKSKVLQKRETVDVLNDPNFRTVHSEEQETTGEQEDDQSQEAVDQDQDQEQYPTQPETEAEDADRLKVLEDRLYGQPKQNAKAQPAQNRQRFVQKEQARQSIPKVSKVQESKRQERQYDTANTQSTQNKSRFNVFQRQGKDKENTQHPIGGNMQMTGDDDRRFKENLITLTPEELNDIKLKERIALAQSADLIYNPDDKKNKAKGLGNGVLFLAAIIVSVGLSWFIGGMRQTSGLDATAKMAINNLQMESLSYKASIATLTDSINKGNTNTQTIQSGLNTLNGQVTTMMQNIKDLQAKVK